MPRVQVEEFEFRLRHALPLPFNPPSRSTRLRASSSCPLVGEPEFHIRSPWAAEIQSNIRGLSGLLGGRKVGIAADFRARAELANCCLPGSGYRPPGSATQSPHPHSQTLPSNPLHNSGHFEKEGRGARSVDPNIAILRVAGLFGIGPSDSRVQFCLSKSRLVCRPTSLARPTGFEPVTSAFGAI